MKILCKSFSSKNQRDTTYRIINKSSSKTKATNKNSKTSPAINNDFSNAFSSSQEAKNNNFSNAFSSSENTKDNDWEDTFTSTPIIDNNFDRLNNESKAIENQNIANHDEMNDNWWDDKYENKFSNSNEPIKRRNNNDSMWDKFTKSVSSIWDNIAKFFNIFQ
ncbi:hypothetical protein ACN4EE_19025 [Geminocystis sp. CENA526]|uniref:hypothetical protein n=1 Tax=Geminocystis sp. CENA526 TaxID=1355871 RepID=UPI003D6EA11A